MTKHFCDVCGKELTDFNFYQVSIIPRTSAEELKFQGTEVCHHCANILYARILSLKKEEPKC